MFGLVSAKRLERANETIDRLQESIEIVKQDREVYFERVLQLKKKNNELRLQIGETSHADLVSLEDFIAEYAVELTEKCMRDRAFKMSRMLGVTLGNFKRESSYGRPRLAYPRWLLTAALYAPWKPGRTPK